MLALVLLATGCAARPGVTIIAPEELPSDLYGEPRVATEDERDVRVTAYFAEQLTAEDFRLRAFSWTGRTDLSPAEFTMQELLDVGEGSAAADALRTANLRWWQGVLGGDEERAAEEANENPRFGTVIPPGTELLRIMVSGSIAAVNLSAAFEEPRPSVIHQLRVAQVVWTLTELSGVDAVRFLIHGQPVPVIDTEGGAHEVVSRARYAAFAPIADELQLDPCPLSERIDGSCPDEA